MNLDLVEYKRSVYNFLEWVAEMGGLATALLSIFGLVFNILMMNTLEYFLVEQVYERSELKALKSDGGPDGDPKPINDDGEKQHDDAEKQHDDDTDDEPLKLAKVNICRANIARMAPAKCRCREKLNKEEDLFLYGLKDLSQKANIITIMKQLSEMQKTIDELR